MTLARHDLAPASFVESREREEDERTALFLLGVELGKLDPARRNWVNAGYNPFERLLQYYYSVLISSFLPRPPDPEPPLPGTPWPW
jgi:hypothetical protein